MFGWSVMLKLVGFGERKVKAWDTNGSVWAVQESLFRFGRMSVRS